MTYKGYKLIEMPNGDLYCAYRTWPDPPPGYYRDSEQPFRFHPKKRQSLSDTVKQGAKKRRNCPECGKHRTQED